MKNELPDLTAVLATAKAAETAGNLDEALRLYERALNAYSPQQGEPAAELLRKIGLVHFWRGSFENAQKYFRESKELALAAGLQRHVAAAINCLAIVHQSLGQLEVAESLYREAQQLAERTGNEVLAVMIDQNLGTIAGIRGDTTLALERYRSALTRYRALGDETGAARVLNNIGMAYVDLQRWREAELAFDQALLAADVRQDAETVATVQLNRGDLYLKRERFDDARACCDQAFEIFGRIGSTSGLGEAYKLYGVLYRASGKLQLAEAHLALVAEIAQSADNRLLEAEAERERALVLLEQGRKQDALKSLSRANRLFTSLKARRAVVDIDRQLDQLEQSYLLIVQAWGESIESRDKYTAGHCTRVAEYTTLLAVAAGIKGRELTWIRMGAFLHDVGKTRMSETVLKKEGGLDEREWEEVRRHTIAGDEIVAELDFPYDIRPMVRNHHERWDGRGYPDGLAGEEIPLMARMLCIADIYDALTTDRSYRTAYSPVQALAIMQTEAGKILDPALFQLFRQLIESQTRSTQQGTERFAFAANRYDRGSAQQQ